MTEASERGNDDASSGQSQDAGRRQDVDSVALLVVAVIAVGHRVVSWLVDGLGPWIGNAGGAPIGIPGP